MTEQEIRDLLEKFYEGNSSLEDEKELSDYFSEKGTAEGLETEKRHFLLLRAARNASPPDITFDTKIRASLGATGAEGRKQVMAGDWLLKSAAALLLLATSFWIGWLASPGNGSNNRELQLEVAQLRAELISTSLRMASPSDRILGVQYSYRLAMLDDAIIEQLTQALHEDESVNVRLAAGNALFQFIDHDKARLALVAAINKQDQHPLVQVTLINMMFAIKEKEAFANIRQALENDNLPPEDREKIQLELLKQTESI